MKASITNALMRSGEATPPSRAIATEYAAHESAVRKASATPAAVALISPACDVTRATPANETAAATASRRETGPKPSAAAISAVRIGTVPSIIPTVAAVESLTA